MSLTSLRCAKSHLQADLHCKGPGRHCLPGFFKTFFICRLIDLRSVASLSDAERTTALTSMGYDVIQITYEQIKDTKSFNNIAELIHKKAGLPYIPKTDQERTAENALRRELLVNWDELFAVKPAG